MRIAVVGAGVAGLGAAWLLSRAHEVVLYERERRLGGHSCTVDVETDAGPQPVDAGFIVFNERNYPNLVALFNHLGVVTAPSDMSFSVSLDEGRFEYGSSFTGYFAQPGNIARPVFLRMTRDILRFNRLAPALLEQCEDLELTIGAFLQRAGFSDSFRDRYLIPMAACIWSTPLGRMLDYPAQTFVRFFRNHGLLSIGPQLAWRTVQGGSRRYVDRLAEPLRARARLGHAVSAVCRTADGVTVRDSSGQWDTFDEIVLACHGDQALSLLADGDPQERALLGCFGYSRNEIWLHGDARLMPRRRAVWSSWNYVAASGERDRPVSVTYWMNRLQPLAGTRPVLLSVNPTRPPAEDTVHARFSFDHPMYDAAAIRAQRYLHSLQGRRHTWFCGSYCGHGFHEDALSAGLEIAEQLGTRRPWPKPGEQLRLGVPPRLVTDEPSAGVLPLPAAARIAPGVP
jgi:predicted NAD/FAD-binding protein